MKVWGLTAEQILAAGTLVGVRVRDLRLDGRALRFVLRTVQPVKYGRRSQHVMNRDWTRRRVPGAVCWHGHRDFMRAIFAANSQARIRTGLATYDGAEHFEETHRQTYGQGNGYNIAFGAACDCDCETARHRGLADSPIRTMRQSDITRCPFAIMMPEHYRADGSCRCNDPVHLEMIEWGYTWNAEAEHWEGDGELC